MAQAALAARRPDFLILGAELGTARGLELCHRCSDPDVGRRAITLLLAERGDSGEIIDALEAGVDDFLARPFVYGEILARLRAGARVLEHERRLLAQADHDVITGLPTRASLVHCLDEALRPGNEPARTASCAVVDMDYFSRLRREHGEPAGDELLRQVVDLFDEQVGDDGVLVALGKDRFAIALPDRTGEEAAGWCESLRTQLAERPFEIQGTPCQLTASFGVANGQSAQETAHEVIEAACRAVESAKQSGRNCVVREGQFEAEQMAWAELATPGKIFEGTVARDVMTPLACLLRHDDTLEDCRLLLRQTRLPLIPVVDSQGKFAGLIRAGDVEAQGEKAENATIGGLIQQPALVHDSDAPFQELLDAFAEHEQPAAVVVSEGQPIGLVTPAGLASLVERISTDTFAATEPYHDHSDWLRVCDSPPLVPA